MAFICGSSANQEDDFEAFWSLPSTPQRKTTKRHSFCSRSNNKDMKNPYSNRGLDKFEALLADLDGKRQKIFTQKGSEDISLVRFVYSNSNDVKPIVVKIKDHRKQDKDHEQNKLENAKTNELSHENRTGRGNRIIAGGAAVAPPAKLSIECKKSIAFDRLRRKFGEWWRPWYCLPLFVMLILVFLLFFGRSFAILCTSIGWYLVPMINTTIETSRSSRKSTKKEYSRKMSEKMILSPRSDINKIPMNNQPHRKSF